MVKSFKFALASLLISFGATVFAQCLPMNAPGPPRLWDGERGCYVPQGTPSLNSFNNQQVIVGGQYYNHQQWQQLLASQAIRVPQGQQVPNGYCSWGGRTENIVASGLLGAFVGVLAGDNHRAAAKGAALGMMVGMFVPCSTLQPQVVVQQGVQQAPNNSNGSCQHDPGTQPGVLNLPGHQKHGQTVCARPGDVNISRWL